MKNEFSDLANNSEWSEKAIEAYLVRRMERLNGKALKYSNPNETGYPDRICLFPGGKVAFVEIKGKRGRLSVLQSQRIQQLLQMRFPAAIVRSKSDVDEFIIRMTSDNDYAV